MSAYAGWDNVGAEGQSYPEVAAQAVRSIHAQHRSPIYGYLRSGINQRIYLFPKLEDARAWFSGVRLRPDYDYAAVFSASNLRAPIAGMEHFARTTVGDDPYVGNWWPFLLGLPLGGLGGYFLRRWQEQHPGQALPLVPPGTLPAPKIPPSAVAPPPGAPGAPAETPKVGGPWLDVVGQDYGYGYGQDYGYSVGGPWVDLVGRGEDVQAPFYAYGAGVGQDYDDESDYVGQDYGDYGYTVGGPWVDLAGPWVGAQADDVARRRAWPQTRALIQSAIDDVTREAASYPAEVYVWILDAPSRPPFAGRAGSIVMLEGTTRIVPFTSRALAIDYLREAAQTRPVALAMFERSSRHWPNPVSWRKSDDPEHEQIIASHVASRTPTTSAGAWDTSVGAAVDDVRRRAQKLAERRAGSVVGVIHTTRDGLWHTLAFRSSDDADDWLGTATQDPASFTYAAYYDKDDFQWPHPVNEKIGGARTPRRPGEPIRREIATSGEWWP